MGDGSNNKGVQQALQLLAMIIIAPFYLAVVLVIITLWLVLTITGIGPLFQWYCNKKDQKILNDDVYQITSGNGSSTQKVLERVVMPSHKETDVGGNNGTHNDAASSSQRRCLAVRWSPGTNPSLPPVAIPNGKIHTYMS